MISRFFITLQAALLVVISWQTSINRTEVGHVAAGVYFYKTFRFDVFRVNGPLTRYFTGGAIVLTSPICDWKSYSPRPQERCEWPMGSAFIKASLRANVHWAIFLARCSLIPLILLGSHFGWRLACEIYGFGAGYVFLILWTFSPLVLGWGTTICPDVVAASLGIIAIYYLRRWLLQPDRWNTFLAGVTLGLLPLAKLTWIFALPIWFAIWLVSGRLNSQYKQIAAMGLIAVYIINMGYCFDGTFKLLKDYQFHSRSLSGNPTGKNCLPIQAGNRFRDSLLGYVPVPLPVDFVQGLDTQKYDFERGMESYFRGQYANRGWWYYYIYLLGVREPLGVWILFIGAIAVTCFYRSFNGTGHDELLLILPAVALLGLICSQSGFSAHPRYVILVLPFLYLWVSKLGQVFQWKGNRLKVMITAVLTWIIASSLLWFPHSMSYFNELVRSPWHGRYFTNENLPPLLGSNIDWGQNSLLIEKWYHSHPDCRPLFLDYQSPEPLDRIGMKFTDPPSERASGWYVLGINELFASSNRYRDFQKRRPLIILGYSIYIYHLSENDPSQETNIANISDRKFKGDQL